MAESWFFDALPLHPSPYAGECLSGYLLRLGQVNGFASFWELATLFFPDWHQTIRLATLRWEYPVEHWGLIPLRTQQSLAVLHQLTVVPLVAKFRRPPLCASPGRRRPGHVLHDLVNPDLRVCPQCLREQPYLRLRWRFLGIQTCPEHGLWLQERCSYCGARLTVMGVRQRHLHCPNCDRELTSLLTEAAPEAILRRDERRQAEVAFLLDPNVTLGRPEETAPSASESAWRESLGLKFRYLRLQTGATVAGLAQQLQVRETLILDLEAGHVILLPFYLEYLEALPCSWADFAALEVPPAFVRSRQEPAHLALRLCPNPSCPNHDRPSVSVNLLADVPAQQLARFQCTICRRRFTRAYSGEIRTKARRPALQPGQAPPMVKPAEEIARLLEMGLRGEDNRRIAHELGWGEKTVRMHWISFGLEDQVHQAQAQRRACEKQQRAADLEIRLEPLLRSLLAQEQEISLAQVNEALGHSNNYLQYYPSSFQQVQEAIQLHNAQVQQRRQAELADKLAHALQELKGSLVDVPIPEIARRIGLTYHGLTQTYPEFHRQVQQAVAEHRAELKSARCERECGQINEAVVRLIYQGVSLSYRAILAEAGLDKYRVQCDPAIRDLLRQWIGEFPARI